MSNSIFMVLMIIIPAICKPTRNLNIQLTRRLGERVNGKLICTNKFARQLLDTYLEKNIQLDVRTFTAAMQISHENNNFEDVLSIFKLMKTKNVTLDRISVGVAVTASMHLNDHECLIALYNECDSLYSLGNSPKYWREDLVLLTAFVVALDKSGHWNELLIIYDTIVKRKIKPSIRIVDSSLRASIKVKDWKRFFSISNILTIFDNDKKRSSNENKILNEKNLTEMSCHITSESFIDELSKARLSEDIVKIINDFSTVKYTEVDDKTRRRMISHLNIMLTGNLIKDNPMLIKEQFEHNTIDAQDYLELTIQPSLIVYGTLMQGAGKLGNATLAFLYWNDAITKSFIPDRTLHRQLIEACTEAKDEVLTTKARELLINSFQSLKINKREVVPEALFQLSGRTMSVKNGPGIYSSAIRALVAKISSTTHYVPDKNTLPESGRHIPHTASNDLIILHCEKQALAAILEFNIATDNEEIKVNLCMCNDCHTFFKLASSVLHKKLYCRDPGNLHLFEEGACSCNDHWSSR